MVVEGALRLEGGLALGALEAVVERGHVALARVLHRDVGVLGHDRVGKDPVRLAKY